VDKRNAAEVPKLHRKLAKALPFAARWASGSFVRSLRLADNATAPIKSGVHRSESGRESERSSKINMHRLKKMSTENSHST
jgi:hypothetical protein